MDRVFEIAAVRRIYLAVLLLAVVHVLHVLEESLTDFRLKVPFGEIPLSVFIIVNTLGFLYVFVTIIAVRKKWKLAVPLASLYAAVMMLNGLLHLGIAMFQGDYFPGATTAPLLLISSGYLIYQLVQSRVK